jgi:hypothetical protein
MLWPGAKAPKLDLSPPVSQAREMRLVDGHPQIVTLPLALTLSP